MAMVERFRSAHAMRAQVDKRAARREQIKLIKYFLRLPFGYNVLEYPMSDDQMFCSI